MAAVRFSTPLGAPFNYRTGRIGSPKDLPFLTLPPPIRTFPFSYTSKQDTLLPTYLTYLTIFVLPDSPFDTHCFPSNPPRPPSALSCCILTLIGLSINHIFPSRAFISSLCILCHSHVYIPPHLHILTLLLPAFNPSTTFLCLVVE